MQTWGPNTGKGNSYFPENSTAEPKGHQVGGANGSTGRLTEGESHNHHVIIRCQPDLYGLDRTTDVLELASNTLGIRLVVVVLQPSSG